MSRNKETVTISGTIRVRNTRTVASGCTPLPAESPMPRVQVRVQGKGRVGLWREIGETQTDFAGHFQVSSNERDRDRRFRIEVRLHSDDLVVRGHLAADWDTVLEQPEVRGEDLENVTLIYGSRSGSSTDATAVLDRTGDHERAEIWMLSRKVLRLLDDLGSPFGARLIRPYRLEAVSPALITYASPATRNVHFEAGESLRNIIHETMHIWAYDHTRALVGGQGRLLPSGIRGGDTHDVQENETTAFHEGFAEFASLQMQTILFGCPAPLPKSRAGLNALPVKSIAEMIHNDDSWQSILTALVTPNLHRFTFGTADDGGAATVQALTNPPTDCRSPSTTFQAILGCFGAAETVAAEHRLGQAEMKDLRKFLDRIAAIVRGSMQGKESALLRLFDPAESVEPAELFQI